MNFGGCDPAKQFNLEYRAADATASPRLALVALIRAGLSGIKAKLPAPPIFSGDPETLTETERQQLGLHRLPATLPDALDCLLADDHIKEWFSPAALETYVGMKRMELKLCDGIDVDELCKRYSKIY